jgi:hypothetical protein
MRIAAALVAATTGLTLAGLAGGAATAAKLTVAPALVRRGGQITIVGTGLAPSLKVTLYMGRPRTDNIAAIGARYASRTGGIRLVKPIPRSTGVGKWAILACQRNCRIKATAFFRVKPS